jgi:hypothetical protein
MYNSLVYYVGEGSIQGELYGEVINTNVRMKNAYKDMDRKPENMRPVGDICPDGF